MKSQDTGSPQSADTPAPNQTATVSQPTEQIQEVIETPSMTLDANTNSQSAELPTRPQESPDTNSQTVEIPKPQPDANTVEATNVPSPVVEATVTQPSQIPQPQATASVAEASSIPSPQVEATVSQQQAAASASEEVTIPITEVSATVLPKITEVETTPQASAQSIPIPKPEVELKPIESLNVAVEASSSVAEPSNVPNPSVSAAVPAARAVPQPQVSADIASSNAVPQPTVSANVSQAQAIPQPTISTSTGQTNAIPQPAVSASVSGSQSIPNPNVNVSVTASTNIPTANPQVSISGSKSIPQPELTASVATAVAVNTDSAQPQVSVSSAQTIPTPSNIQSSVSVQSATTVNVSPQLSIATPSNTANNGGGNDNSSNNIATGVNPNDGSTRGQTTNNPGGNADRSGQTTDQAGADPNNLGLAAGPDGSNNPTGAPLTRVPYREERERPLNVLIDNVKGYPQMGLREASMIIEMPVEGGLTRLMTSYSNIDPAKVGPVRSARDYFQVLNSSMNGILVHAGGSPSAMALISKSSTPTFDAQTSGDLFARAQSSSAPYNLYSNGASLRKEMSRLHLNRTTVVEGTKFLPAPDTAVGPNVSVRYSATYKTGFKYQENLDLYRWVRNGKAAVDATGEAVYVDAVVVANIKATPIPGDAEGRLYIPLSGGPATLYIRGKKLAGHWSPKGGLEFSNTSGEIIDLSPYKLWVVYAPQSSSLFEE